MVPQTAKQDWDRISEQFLCNMWKKHIELPNVEGVSIRSRNGAPFRKGCVVNAQMSTPPPPPPSAFQPIAAIVVVRGIDGKTVLEWLVLVLFGLLQAQLQHAHRHVLGYNWKQGHCCACRRR